MGHSIHYYDCKDEVKAKNLMVAEAEDDCMYGSDSRSGLPGNIEWFSTIMPDRDEAMKFIRKRDEGSFYLQIAVRYYNYGKPKQSKTLDKLYEQMRKATFLKDELIKKLSTDFTTCKSAYVGCPECGSKLKRSLIISHHCPLCNRELFSDTAIKRIMAADEKMQNSKRKYEEYKNNLAKKNKPEVYWLLKTEYHE